MEVIKEYENVTALGQEWTGEVEARNEESVLEPPGFERVAKANNESAQENVPLPREEDNQEAPLFETPDGDRVDPSQQNKESKKIANTEAERNSQRSNGNSVDSLDQLAIEALEIGKLLGVTVIQHKRPAKDKVKKSSKKPETPVAKKGEARRRRQQGSQNC